MTPNHRIYRAAARIVSRGWVQNRWRDRHGNVCLLQAVIDALGIKQDAADLPWNVLAEIDASLMRTGTYCVTAEQSAHRNNVMLDRNTEHLEELIWRWNDEPGRTQAEVIAVLTATADRLEGRERLWLRDLVARAIRPNPRWRHFDDAELYEEDELTVA